MLGGAKPLPSKKDLICKKQMVTSSGRGAFQLSIFHNIRVLIEFLLIYVGWWGNDETIIFVFFRLSFRWRWNIAVFFLTLTSPLCEIFFCYFFCFFQISKWCKQNILGHRPIRRLQCPSMPMRSTRYHLMLVFNVLYIWFWVSSPGGMLLYDVINFRSTEQLNAVWINLCLETWTESWPPFSFSFSFIWLSAPKQVYSLHFCILWIDPYLYAGVTASLRL